MLFVRVGSALVFCWLFVATCCIPGRSVIFTKKQAYVCVLRALECDYDLTLYTLQTNGSLRVFLLV